MPIIGRKNKSKNPIKSDKLKLYTLFENKLREKKQNNDKILESPFSSFVKTCV